MSKRDQRVILALKWHYLDHLEVPAIQERFEETGHGSFAKSTIRDYLNEEPADEVERMIEEEHANVRLQIAEREERMWRRARDAEDASTKDEPIKRVVPKTDTVPADRDGPIRWPEWELVEPGDDDRPEWAHDRDVIIRFTDGYTDIMPGQRYPIQAIDNSPSYTTEMVGLERDVDDLKGQAMARQEQSSHLKSKGDALGVYSTDINMNVDGDVDHSIELDAETAAAIREADLDE